MEFLKKRKERQDADSVIYEIYWQNRSVFYAVAFDILQDRFAAEDILQEVYVHLMDKTARFRSLPADKRVSYFYICVKNAALNAYKKRNAEHLVPVNEAIGSCLYDGESPEEIMISQESIARLEAAVKDLDEQYRTILLLSCNFDFSDREIAGMLEISENVVRVRRHRARKILKEALKEGVPHE